MTVSVFAVVSGALTFRILGLGLGIRVLELGLGLGLLICCHRSYNCCVRFSVACAKSYMIRRWGEIHSNLFRITERHRKYVYVLTPNPNPKTVKSPNLESLKLCNSLTLNP